MAKTHPSWTVDTTFSAKNIASAASVYAFTAAADARVSFTVKLTNAAGGGDYVVYLTHDWLGGAAAATVLPKSTCAAAAGETRIEFVTIPVDVKATDVVNVMVDGLAGDTSVNGAIRIVADNPSVFEATDTVTAVTTVTTLTGHTAQTGDAYAIVNHATYGNAQLARTGADSDTLETLSDQLDLVGGGATTYSYSNTVDDGSGNLLDGVFIQCATDAAFTNIVSTATTNSLGAFTVYDDVAGTHYLRLQFSGITFTDQTVTLA